MRNQLHFLYLLWSQAFTPHTHGHEQTFSNIFIPDTKHLNQTPSTRIQTMSQGVHSNHATFWVFSYRVFKFKDIRYQWQKLRGSKFAGNTVEFSNLLSRQVIIKDMEVLPQPCQTVLPTRKGKKECWC